MMNRSIVLLVLLAIFVIAYDWRHVKDCGGPLEDVQGKVKNGTRLNSWPSSLFEARLDNGQQLPAGEPNVDDIDDHKLSINQEQQKQKQHWQQLVPTDHASAANPDKGGSTTSVIDGYNKTIIINEAPVCCLCPSVDVEKRLTPEFFEHERTIGIERRVKWTGREYEEWVALLSRLNPNHENQTNLDCPTQYALLVLEQATGLHLRTVLTELVENGELAFFPYNEEMPGLPRILLLGDSISRGTRIATQQLFGRRANIQGAPTNCGGFEKYRRDLKLWLGYCSWDVVQFNVGLHFHPEFPDRYTSWREEYGQGITDIVNEIRAHSPSAQIVFALTTPSPFDSQATTPERATCPHYDKFHKAGFVAAMNDVAKLVATELGITVNDRYSAILPELDRFQMDCNVHFIDRGYKFLARQDWKVFSKALSLKANSIVNAQS